MNDPKGGVAKVTWPTFAAMGQIPAFHRTYFLLIITLVYLGRFLYWPEQVYCESNGVKVLINEHKFTSLQVTVTLNLNTPLQWNLLKCCNTLLLLRYFTSLRLKQSHTPISLVQTLPSSDESEVTFMCCHKFVLNFIKQHSITVWMYAEGESKGKQANPGSPGRVADVRQACACLAAYSENLRSSVVHLPILHLSSSVQWCWTGGRGILRELSLCYSIV